MEANGTSSRHAILAVLSAFTVVVLLQGCAAIPLAAVGGSALQAGGGALVKRGTEYSSGGTAFRTFSIPVDDVHIAVLEAFRRTDITVKKDEASSKGQRIVGEAQHRSVRIGLTPLTRTLTAMELTVKRNILAGDKATASELLAQTEQVLAEKPRLAPEVEEKPSDAAAMKKARAGAAGSAEDDSATHPRDRRRHPRR